MRPQYYTWYVAYRVAKPILLYVPYVVVRVGGECRLLLLLFSHELIAKMQSVVTGQAPITGGVEYYLRSGILPQEEKIMKYKKKIIHAELKQIVYGTSDEKQKVRSAYLRRTCQMHIIFFSSTLNESQQKLRRQHNTHKKRT